MRLHLCSNYSSHDFIKNVQEEDDLCVTFLSPPAVTLKWWKSPGRNLSSNWNHWLDWFTESKRSDSLFWFKHWSAERDGSEDQFSPQDSSTDSLNGTESNLGFEQKILLIKWLPDFDTDSPNESGANFSFDQTSHQFKHGSAEQKKSESQSWLKDSPIQTLTEWRRDVWINRFQNWLAEWKVWGYFLTKGSLTHGTNEEFKWALTETFSDSNTSSAEKLRNGSCTGPNDSLSQILLPWTKEEQISKLTGIIQRLKHWYPCDWGEALLLISREANHNFNESGSESVNHFWYIQGFSFWSRLK